MALELIKVSDFPKIENPDGAEWFPLGLPDGTAVAINIDDFKTYMGFAASANYKGNATPSTDPGTPAGPEFYTATEVGTYTNFGGIEVGNGEWFVLLSYDGENWSKAVVNIPLDDYVAKSGISYEAGGKNLFNKEDLISGKYVNNNGDITTGADFYATQLIPVKENTNYTLSGITPSSPAKYYRVSNDEDVLLSPGQLGSDTITITTSEGAKYLQFTARIDTDSASVLDTIQVEEGPDATAYEPYIAAISYIDGFPVKNADKDIYTKSEVNNLLPVFTKEQVAGKNKANPDNIIDDKYIATSNGSIFSGTDWKIIWIPVEANTVYTISGWESGSKAIRYEDNVEDLISFETVPAIETEKTITTPAGCVKMYFTIKRNTDSTDVYESLQVEEGPEATAYEPYSSQEYVTEVDGLPILADSQPSPTVSDKKMQVKKSGDDIWVRRSFDSNRDIVIKLDLSNNNNIVNLREARLIGKTAVIDDSGTLIHNMPDNTAPLQYSYIWNIGGNHGVQCMLATVASHDKDSSDLTSEWTDGSDNNFYLTEIVSATQLLFLGKPRTEATGELGFPYQMSGSTLSHVSGATHSGDITGITDSADQRFPGTKNGSVSVMVDDRELGEDGLYDCDSAKIVDTHQVIDPSTLVIQSPMVWNDASSVAEVNVVYNFLPNGLQIDYSINSLIDHEVRNFGFIQSVPLTTGGSLTKVKYYIPGTKPVTGGSENYDFSEIVDVTAGLDGDITMYNADMDNEDEPASRIIQLLTDNSNVKDVGLAIGYNILYGSCKDAERTQNGNIIYIRGSSAKLYPRVYSGRMTAGQVIYGTAYYIYFGIPDQDITDIYYIKDGDGYLVYVDTHAPLDKKTVVLPDVLLNRMAEVVRKSDSMTLHTPDYTIPPGIVISGTGELILRLS